MRKNPLWSHDRKNLINQNHGEKYNLDSNLKLLNDSRKEVETARANQKSFHSFPHLQSIKITIPTGQKAILN